MALLAIIGVALMGCEPPATCESFVDVIDAEAWTFVAPEDDTLWPAPDDAELCEASDVQVQPVGDDLAVEIDTRFGCGWATAEQALAEDIDADDELQIRIFYFSQSSFPAAEAEVAVAIDDEILVSERIAIPTSSGLLAPRVTPARAHAAGAPIRFHIGNHGDNSWNLVEVARVRKAPCE